MVALGLATGLRVGEAKSIRWQDANFEATTISVTGQMRFLNDAWVRRDRKTKASLRTVSVPEFVMAILKSLHAPQMPERMETTGEEWNPHRLVFVTPFGTPWHSKNVNQKLHGLLRRAGLSKIRFHDLRHNAASHLLMADIPLKNVSVALGHGDTRTTADTYGHVLPDAMKEVAKTAQNLFG